MNQRLVRDQIMDKRNSSPDGKKVPLGPVAIMNEDEVRLNKDILNQILAQET